MELSLESSDGNLRNVACRGDLTLLDLQRDVDPLEQLLKPEGFTSKVLLNLDKTTYMDTAGVGWLIQHKKFQERGGCLILYSIPPLLDQIFQLLKLPAVLHVAGDEAAARHWP